MGIFCKPACSLNACLNIVGDLVGMKVLGSSVPVPWVYYEDACGFGVGLSTDSLLRGYLLFHTSNRILNMILSA